MVAKAWEDTVPGYMATGSHRDAPPYVQYQTIELSCCGAHIGRWIALDENMRPRGIMSHSPEAVVGKRAAEVLHAIDDIFLRSTLRDERA